MSLHPKFIPWDILYSEDEIEIKNVDTIVKYFKNSCSGHKEMAIGVECERSGVYKDDLSPVQYVGANGRGGYLDILKKLNHELGWEVVYEENGNIYELQRCGTRIGIENDGRLELASKPRLDLHDLAREFLFYNHEISEISKIFGIAFLGMGYQPFSTVKEILYAPRIRAKIIDKLYKSGVEKQKWMKLANGLHINIDYTSEEDAIRKSQILWRISSILAAMFACSPLENGKRAKHLDQRLYVNQRMDKKRIPLQKEFLDKNFSFKKWVDYCVDLPIFYLMRDGKPIYPKSTFREFIKNSEKTGNIPTIRDFNLHLKSIWSEVRLRKYIEFRSLDSIPQFLLMSAPVLIKGLLYSENALTAVEKLVGDFKYDELMQLRTDVLKENLRANFRGKSVLSYAKELIDIANENLKSFKNLNEKGEDESVYLEPLKEFIFVKEKSPARYLIEKWEGEWHKDNKKLVEWSTAETRPL
ncbi:MAG: glutamate-cysteine ligase, glutamate-cysteine ligase [Candidatus Peregrinibacteria bacterium GW2011_GWF2_38_29]|nr:MAG: glutamate-cysteine ligase, glutamate-cysteine ligase [Candidatus Peregrinibacteria bacterium GW2011_GWF2_38_29]HBB02446.1 hypothetical protein [Candidatus Peregrinibacteria bacterium]